MSTEAGAAAGGRASTVVDPMRGSKSRRIRGAWAGGGCGAGSTGPRSRRSPALGLRSSWIGCLGLLALRSVLAEAGVC
jgi:hypothetical protein